VNALLWKLNRVRAMGLPEILYRMRQVLQVQAEARGCGLAKPAPPSEDQGRIWSWEESGVARGIYLDAADRILSGHYDIFSLQNCFLGFPPRWNTDPLSEKISPLEFGKSLNYRDESLVGNIKYLWEINRHLELVTLAQAFHLSQDPKYTQACRTLLQSWFDQCPYPLGPNWTSSLEHSVRLMNWAFAWHLLGGCEGEIFSGVAGQAFKQQWLTSIFQHCHFIAGYFSRFSSANNHLFGEYMGLFVGSTVWPYWQESASWQNRAQAGLEEEAFRQTAADGSNREQAIWYHHEVADMMLLCGLVGRANGLEFPPPYWQRLEAMIGFISAMLDVGGNVPMIGDADDGVMVRFCPDPEFSVYRSLLATGSVLFNRPDFACKAKVFDDKSRWLLGGVGEKVFQGLLATPEPKSPEHSRAFPVSGYWILSKNQDTEREVKLVVDAGPLGYLSIAAHGHADALAMTLSIAGLEMLIDPGTYAYHTEPKWRNYFKGTSAHNTLRLDGLDQSVSGGNFMWLKHASAHCELFEPGIYRDVFVGVHDGYTRLKDSVIHRRQIELDKNLDQILVLDTVECASQHWAELFWHVAESCTVQVQDREVLIRNGKVFTTVSMPQSDWVPNIYTGNEELPLGWISRRFDRKEPTTTIVWAGEVSGGINLQTLFQYHFDI